MLPFVKRIIPLLFSVVLALGSVSAQQSDVMAEAVRAYNTGDYVTAKSLFQSLLSLNPRNTAAKNYLTQITLKERSGPSMETRLKQITIAKVDFQETTPREAMTYVSQQVNKTIKDGKKLNIVWLVPADVQAPPVTLNLHDAPANEVLRYIAEMAGLKLSYEEFALKVTPDKPETTSEAASSATQ